MYVIILWVLFLSLYYIFLVIIMNFCVLYLNELEVHPTTFPRMIINNIYTERKGYRQFYKFACLWIHA
jgi:hypothetical protein